MLLADLDHGRTIDLTLYHDHFPDLTHSKNYDLCNRMGRFARDQSIGLFRTPSARKDGGICVPVFSEDAIQSDCFQYDYYLTFELNSAVITIEKRGVIEFFEIPEKWG